MVRHSDFLQAIAYDHDDGAARLVYADWLEEQGDATSLRQAEFLRLTVQLTREPSVPATGGRLERIRQLAAGLDSHWLAAVDRASLIVLEDVSQGGVIRTSNLVEYQI